MREKVSGSGNEKPDRRKRGEKGRLSKAEWISSARAALIRSGIDGVKVDLLARSLRVTRGSFYWHFGSRSELLVALMRAWSRDNTSPFLKVLEANGANPALQYRNYVEIWLRASEFDPAYDSAVRDWARTSAAVTALVEKSDAARMNVLRRIFRSMGYGDAEAEVRSRITYFHQVGYYAMRIREPTRTRRRLLPIYFKVLAGVPMPPDD